MKIEVVLGTRLGIIKKLERRQSMAVEPASIGRLDSTVVQSRANVSQKW